MRCQRRIRIYRRNTRPSPHFTQRPRGFVFFKHVDMSAHLGSVASCCSSSGSMSVTTLTGTRASGSSIPLLLLLLMALFLTVASIRGSFTNFGHLAHMPFCAALAAFLHPSSSTPQGCSFLWAPKLLIWSFFIFVILSHYFFSGT